jgi:hypothetical protein
VAQKQNRSFAKKAKSQFAIRKLGVRTRRGAGMAQSEEQGNELVRAAPAVDFWLAVRGRISAVVFFFIFHLFLFFIFIFHKFSKSQFKK